jgi:hypothetical protein
MNIRLYFLTEQLARETKTSFNRKTFFYKTELTFPFCQSVRRKVDYKNVYPMLLHFNVYDQTIFTFQ